jgi:hypothetical protein
VKDGIDVPRTTMPALSEDRERKAVRDMLARRVRVVRGGVLVDACYVDGSMSDVRGAVCGRRASRVDRSRRRNDCVLCVREQPCTGVTCTPRRRNNGDGVDLARANL